MSNYTLKFLSKNKNFSRNSFIFYLNTKYLYQNYKVFYYKKPTKKTKFTILKSPHVNKSSQEQFESRSYYKELKFFPVKKNKLFLVLYKKFKNKLFSDSRVNFKVFINNKKYKQNINIIDLKLNFFKKFKNKSKLSTKRNKNKLKNYLKLVDLYGELALMVQ